MITAEQISSLSILRLTTYPPSITGTKVKVSPSLSLVSSPFTGSRARPLKKIPTLPVNFWVLMSKTILPNRWYLAPSRLRRPIIDLSPSISLSEMASSLVLSIPNVSASDDGMISRYTLPTIYYRHTPLISKQVCQGFHPVLKPVMIFYILDSPRVLAMASPNLTAAYFASQLSYIPLRAGIVSLLYFTGFVELRYM